MSNPPDGQPIPDGLRTTFRLHALLAGAVGIQHLLLPKVWTDLAGMQIVETVTWRLIGAALIAFAVSSWLASKEAVWTRVRTLVVMEAVWSVVAAATITWGLLVEGLAPLEWLNVAILAVFAIAFTRYLAVFEVGGPDDADGRVPKRDLSDFD